MPDTVVGVIIAVALILPGFVIAELSMVGRARAQTSELETVLRALFYALLLHVLASPWTRELALRIDPLDEWTQHLNALLLYTLVVLGAVPVTTGLLLGGYLRRVETRGSPGALYSVLGARDARDAWDYVFQRLDPGAWLIIELGEGRLVGGKYGEHSSVGQSPSEHDLYLQELWHVDDTGFEPNLFGRVEPARGMWIAADQVRSVRVLNPPYAVEVE